jgi:hypothetical protein
LLPGQAAKRPPKIRHTRQTTIKSWRIFKTSAKPLKLETNGRVRTKSYQIERGILGDDAARMRTLKSNAERFAP